MQKYIEYGKKSLTLLVNILWTAILVLFMKRFCFILSVIVAIILSACKSDNVSSPVVRIGGIVINNGIPFDKGEVYIDDTINVLLELIPFYDKLTYLKVNIDRECLKDSTFSDKEIKEICDLSTTDKSKGEYYFSDKIGYGVALQIIPARIIVKKCPQTESNTLAIEYELKSTANVKPEYNPTRNGFYIKVLDMKRPK